MSNRILVRLSHRVSVVVLKNSKVSGNDNSRVPSWSLNFNTQSPKKIYVYMVWIIRMSFGIFYCRRFTNLLLPSFLSLTGRRIYWSYFWNNIRFIYLKLFSVGMETNIMPWAHLLNLNNGPFRLHSGALRRIGNTSGSANLSITLISICIQGEWNGAAYYTAW